jgi:hypothetical protein
MTEAPKYFDIINELHTGLRSSGMWRSVEWQFCTDVSGRHIGPTFKGQEVQKDFILALLDPWRRYR